WSKGLEIAGYGGYIVASWVASLMYLCLILCLAEMCLSIPVVGGCFAFARAVGGDIMGFIVGNSEGIEYVIYLSMVLTGTSELTAEIFEFSHQTWAPLIWVVFLLVCYFATAISSRWSWNIMAGLTFLCFIEAISFLVFAMAKTYDPLMWREDVVIKEQLETPGKSILFPGGGIGMLSAIPIATWWFTGIEIVSLASTEAKDSVKTVPRAFVSSWIINFGLAILTLVFQVLAKPGAGSIGKEDKPMILILTTAYGPEWRKIGLGLMFPPYLITGIAVLWAATRQSWALSRSGFLPQFMSLTAPPAYVPWRASLFSAIYAFCMALVATYFKSPQQGIQPDQILLDLTILSSVMTYAGVAVVFLLFR
ncbi:hypothetical protein HDV05_001347, partial [Chytridiales sp. JEL 0842]